MHNLRRFPGCPILPVLSGRHFERALGEVDRVHAAVEHARQAVVPRTESHR